jgi:hypothetical protein
MNFQNFVASLIQEKEPDFENPLLLALWYDGKNDWEKAHNLLQDQNNTSGAWVHAYLHRKEGDVGNARYWYRLAGKPFPNYSLKTEWEELVQSFLKEKWL